MIEIKPPNMCLGACADLTIRRGNPSASQVMGGLWTLADMKFVNIYRKGVPAIE
jgi:hypothetical protein